VHLGTIMPVASLEDESLPAIKKQKKSDECGSGDDATNECSNECGGGKVADSRDHIHHSTVHSSGTPHSHSGATATLSSALLPLIHLQQGRGWWMCSDTPQTPIVYIPHSLTHSLTQSTCDVMLYSIYYLLLICTPPHYIACTVAE
jgi:hypothetical protein